MPRVSISLVTWNGMSWLPACLESVRAQTMADWELLVVDNASSDGSTAWLLAQAADDPRIRVQALATNTGYGAAHNRSIRAARADVLVLLNQDVVLDPGFLHAACDELDADLSLGAVQGWIGRLGPSGERLDVTDSTGLVIHRDRRVVSRDQLLRRPPEERLPGYVWGADGPAPVYRRRALLEVRVPRRGGGWEVLDEDFFAEKEDADLAWRLQRMGWRCRHQPALMAWHARSGGDSGADGLAAGARANMTNPAAVRIRAWRNQRLMQLKNDELRRRPP